MKKRNVDPEGNPEGGIQGREPFIPRRPAIWKLGNKEITDGPFLPKLVKAMEMQTMGELKNLTRTMGFRTMAGMESLRTVLKCYALAIVYAKAATALSSWA